MIRMASLLYYELSLGLVFPLHLVALLRGFFSLWRPGVSALKAPLQYSGLARGRLGRLASGGIFKGRHSQRGGDKMDNSR